MVPKISTQLHIGDTVGSWKARWGIGRIKYRIKPGLYAVGNPTPESLVLVSANYKMSFDCLRSQLTGIDAWIMVLDTKGINVWCAAGKGTFGTREIINRMQIVGLHQIVSHRKLLVPQLGATGVSAHQVKKLSGFKVIFGPVRAQDIPAFLSAGLKATPQMRRVHFNFRDRIVLIPNDIVGLLKYAIPVAAGFFLLSGLYSGGFSIELLLSSGVWSAIMIFGVYLISAVLIPMLLPWLPGKSFSVKGGLIGLVFALIMGSYAVTHPVLYESPLSLIAWLLIIPAVASFIAMNFTGASTYTSLSGVRKEMRIAVPLQIIGAAVGMGLWITGRFV